MKFEFFGIGGFEPPTFCTQNRHAKPYCVIFRTYIKVDNLIGEGFEPSIYFNI